MTPAQSSHLASMEDERAARVALIDASHALESARWRALYAPPEDRALYARHIERLEDERDRAETRYREAVIRVVAARAAADRNEDPPPIPLL
jgi:hypothetical protein